MAGLAAEGASGPDYGMLGRIVALNQEAIDRIKVSDFAAARRSLREAEAVCKRARLDEHGVMARTYVHLGALAIIGFRDEATAQKYFGQAIDIDQDIKVTGAVAVAAVQRAFAATRAQKVLVCEYPRDQVRFERPVIFHCKADRSTAAAVLHYQTDSIRKRSDEAKTMKTVPMTKDPSGAWSAELSWSSIEGSTFLDFYVEGLDDGGRPVVTCGNARHMHTARVVAKSED